MRKIHLISGIALLVIFSLTGQYMAHSLDLSNSEFNAQCMMYRASHIYLLFAGCVNSLVGCYWLKASNKVAIYIQMLGSALVILSQVLLLFTFYFEPPTLDQDRLLTFAGCLCLLLGVLLTLVSNTVDINSIAKAKNYKSINYAPIGAGRAKSARRLL